MKRKIAALAVLVLAIGLVTPAMGQEDPKQPILNWLAQLDKNKDGNVTRDEFPEQMSSEEFDRMDRDKDGKISKQEMNVIRRLVELQSRRQANLPKPDFANVSYGPHKRNVFDLWKAKSDTPTPLVLFIHGGGFVAGDKGIIHPHILNALLKANVSVAATNYRFTRTAVYPAPMHDCARAVQFIRLHADEYNIDPNLIGATGGSAGAGISLWLGAHDDLAKPESEDPVERQSTRLQCVAVFSGQTSYDPRFIQELFNTTETHAAILLLYGIKSAEDFANPHFQALFEDASPINHATADDAPIMLLYGQANIDLPPNTPGNVHIHHPKFGLTLKPKLEALGVECVVRLREDYPGNTFNRKSHEDAVAFLVKHLVDPEAAPSASNATPEPKHASELNPH